MSLRSRPLCAQCRLCKDNNYEISNSFSQFKAIKHHQLISLQEPNLLLRTGYDRGERQRSRQVK